MLLLALTILGAAGCASPGSGASPQSFEFHRDTFAFPNETLWLYEVDPDTGRMSHRRRKPRPDYAQRCFVVVRAAKEFHLHARFEPDLAPVAPDELRSAIRSVIRRSPRRGSTEARRVVIPGFTGLRQLSEVHGDLVRREAGGSWQSYVQRGHWRMVFPFSAVQRQRLADRLAERLAGDEPGSPAVLHVVRFPRLTINHAVLVYAVETTERQHRFLAYDPNEAGHPVELVFDRATRRFELPPLPYFPGGPVEAYEVYSSAFR